MSKQAYVKGKYVRKNVKTLEEAEVSHVQDAAMNKLSGTPYLINETMLDLFETLLANKDVDPFFEGYTEIQHLPSNVHDLDFHEKQAITEQTSSFNTKVTTYKDAIAIARLFAGPLPFYLPTFMD